MDGPAPGSYDDQKSYNYVNKKKEFTESNKSTEKRKTFTEGFAE